MEIITRKAAIQKSLSNIGKTNSSAPPESKSNTFGLAYELFVASELRSASNKRYDAAKEAAVKAGVIDESKTVEGSEVSTHVNEYFDVTMKKAASGVTLDPVALRSNLMKLYNLNETQVDNLITVSGKPRKGAVTIGFALKG